MSLPSEEAVDFADKHLMGTMNGGAFHHATIMDIPFSFNTDPKDAEDVAVMWGMKLAEFLDMFAKEAIERDRKRIVDALKEDKKFLYNSYGAAHKRAAEVVNNLPERANDDRN